MWTGRVARDDRVGRGPRPRRCGGDARRLGRGGRARRWGRPTRRVRRALTDGTYRAFVYDVVVAVVVGSLVGLVVPTLGGIPAIVSYLFVLGAGTLLGVTLLLREGPRAAGAVLAASGPVFLVTDKLLWDPLVAALGFDIAGLLSTWPLALGLLLLARASLHSHPVERPADGTPADTRPTDGGQS